MGDLRNKKLLILGGTKISMEIVRSARKLGATVYVTDYLENSPAKKVADNSFMVSTTDVDSVVNLIKKEKIDGVLTGFVDTLLPFYQQICQKAGLPCYATKEQIEICIDKNRFKELCRKFGIPVVPEYTLNYPLDINQIGSLEYPLLIKPVDNSGARGVFICNNSRELEKKYEICLNFSNSKKILVEKYVQAKEATIFYLIQDGEIVLSSMADRHVNHNQLGIIPLPVCYTFPSKHLEDYQKILDPKVREMFQSIDIKNGIIFIQSFIENGECIFYEMGFRLTGTLEYKIIESFNGINPMQMMINFALTGKMCDFNIRDRLQPNYNKYGFNITYLIKPGQIGKINGINKILKFDAVMDAVLSYDVNDIIPDTAVGTLQQVILRVFGATQDKLSLKKIINKIHNTIEVQDINGNNMLLAMFDPSEI